MKQIHFVFLFLFIWSCVIGLSACLSTGVPSELTEPLSEIRSSTEIPQDASVNKDAPRAIEQRSEQSQNPTESKEYTKEPFIPEPARDASENEILVDSGREPVQPEEQPETSPPDFTGTYPPNTWVKLAKTKTIIPKVWSAGRHKNVNSFGSEVYCDKNGEMLSMDGYITTPPGKASPANYSDSLYGFNPDTSVFRLIKRSHWRAGARAKGPRGSYPLDENKTEPTPCPRHTYNGICYSTDTEKFYLINGANAGVPNTQHPKWAANKGTDTFTFWSFDFGSKKWTQLAYPKVARKEPYETILRAMPGTNKLYLIQLWSLWSYNTKTEIWKAEIPKGRSAIGSGSSQSMATVDPKRKRIIMLRSAVKIRQGQPVEDKHKFVGMNYYDVATNKFIVIPTFNIIEGKSKAGLAYIDHMDCYAVRTEKGLFLYYPQTQKWKRAKIKQFVIQSKSPWSWNYMNYDKKRKILILRKEAALRLDPTTLQLEDL